MAHTTRQEAMPIVEHTCWCKQLKKRQATCSRCNVATKLQLLQPQMSGGWVGLNGGARISVRCRGTLPLIAPACVNTVDCTRRKRAEMQPLATIICCASILYLQNPTLRRSWHPHSPSLASIFSTLGLPVSFSSSRLAGCFFFSPEPSGLLGLSPKYELLSFCACPVGLLSC